MKLLVTVCAKRLKTKALQNSVLKMLRRTPDFPATSVAYSQLQTLVGWGQCYESEYVE